MFLNILTPLSQTYLGSLRNIVRGLTGGALASANCRDLRLRLLIDDHFQNLNQKLFGINTTKSINFKILFTDRPKHFNKRLKSPRK